MTREVYFPWIGYAFWLLTVLFFLCRVSIRPRRKIFWAIVLLGCFSKFLVFREFGGRVFNPNLPDTLIWVWDWAYAGGMILFALSVLCFFRFRAKAVLLPVLAWSLAAWGLWNGVCLPDVREVELSFENLPPSLNGYRIVQLTDLHCSHAARRWRTQGVVDRVNALKPDLICLTGDYVDGYVADCASFLEPLASLRAKDGVLACTGNHEYYFNYHAWRTKFYANCTNILFLTNACAFPRPQLAVAGVPDPAGRRHGFGQFPDVRTAFAAATNGEFRILMQHQPKYFGENVREHKLDLQLSGHSHGGIAPLMRQIVARVNNGFVRGVYRIGNAAMYVSSGCGQWAGFPLRFFTPSEITVIILTSRPAPHTPSCSCPSPNNK